MMVMPLADDDPPAVRKARVAELHALWVAAGCASGILRDSNCAVMNMLLRQRYGGEL